MTLKINKILRVIIFLIFSIVAVGCTQEYSDNHISKAVNSLVEQMPSVVEMDIDWPQLDLAYTKDLEAKFVSTDVNIVSDEGKINRSVNDVEVVIKVGVVKLTDNTYYSKDVSVTVRALTAEQIFELIELELDTTIPASAKKNIDFSSFTYLNAQVIYESDNEEAITNTGVVTQGAEDTLVNLHITVTFNQIKKTYDYQIIILKKDSNENQPPIDGVKMKVHVINVGQGDAMVIELPNNQVLMIDAGKGLYGGQGSDQTIKKYLNDLNITTIDYFVVSHPHSDHYEWLPMILGNFTVKNIYFSAKTRTNPQYLTAMQAIKDAGLTIQIPKPGEYIFNFTDLNLLTIANKSVSDVNASSLMVKLTYKNNTFMFTGDGGFGSDEAENRALKSGLDLHADVLKVGHHGSGGSSSVEFLSAVGAQYGLLTTAFNSGTGHPHETAMNRLKNAKVDLYQTRDLGHIIVICDGENYQFNSINNNELIENVAPSDPWRS